MFLTFWQSASEESDFSEPSQVIDPGLVRFQDDNGEATGFHLTREG